MRAETRHQLKQDKFSQATIGVAGATVDWTVEHRSKLVLGAIIVLAVVLLGVGGWYYFTQQDQKASVDLGKATRTLETPLRPAGSPPQADFPMFASANERATEARKQFQAVVDNYPHTHSADVAHYFIGITAAQLGDTSAAERELKTVAGQRNEDLASLANLALAAVYREANRSKDAIAIYQQLANKPTRAVGKVTAQLALAATYQADQQPLEAKRVYEQIQKENPSSEASQLASQRLQEIK